MSKDLEQAIYDTPESEDAWASYAEHLTEQGDIRGELISLELTGGSDRVKEIFHHNMGKWCGEELTSLLAKLALAEENESCLTINWKYGFIESFRVDSYYSMTVETEEILKTVINSPAVKFIQKISVGVLDWDSAHNKAVQIITEKNLPALRELHLGDTDEMDISWMAAGDISGIFSSAPNLTSLRVKGAGIELGTLSHTSLKELILETGGLPAKAIKSVMEAELPSLEKLEMWFGDNYYGAEGSIDMLDPLLSGSLFPKLHNLGLMNSEFQNEIAEALSKSPLLAQLKKLDMSMGVMQDNGAKVLIENVDRFSHLESIDVSDNFITDAVCDKLKELYGDKIDVSSQDYAEDEDDVYVSAGE